MLKSICIFVLLLSACSYTQDSYRNKKKVIDHHKQSNIFLQQAAETHDVIAKNRYRLLAAHHLLLSEHIKEAEAELTQIVPTKYDYSLWYIIQGELAFTKQDLERCFYWLRFVVEKDLNVEQRYIFYNIRAKAYANTNELVLAAQDRSTMNSLITDDDEREYNKKQIFNLLNKVDVVTLKNINNQDNNFYGWVQLIVAINEANDVRQRTLAVNEWKSKFANHEAQDFANEYVATEVAGPTLLKEKQNFITVSNQGNIGLVLPLRLITAQTIKNGFMIAARQDNAEYIIKIYNSSQDSIENIYERALQDGVSFLVGPLIKEDVKKIAKLQLQIPVLALNAVHSYNKNLLQLSLSPEDEAIAIAKKMKELSLKMPLLIVENTDWGKRNVKAFKDAWDSAECVVSFLQKREINEQISDLLSINTSEQRAQKLKDINIKFKFNAQRRQDIDSIFLITKKELAKQIKPLLNFYYAGNVPTFSLSVVFSGKEETEHDLNGIRFCDAPWMLDGHVQDNYKQYAVDVDPTAFSSRLIGLGIDAYKVAKQLRSFNNYPTLGLQGTTGTLHLTDNGYIARDLLWATFMNGKPQLSS